MSPAKLIALTISIGKCLSPISDLETDRYPPYSSVKEPKSDRTLGAGTVSIANARPIYRLVQSS